MITCFDCRVIDPFQLREEDITPELLAHHLARVNRFAGATKWPISVGQHSVYVARVVRALGGGVVQQVQGLVHDGSEGLIADIVKWVKATPSFEGYRTLEDFIQAVVYRRFKVPEVMDPLVEEADRLMVCIEALRGYPTYPFTHPRYPRPTKEEIKLVGTWQPWSYRKAQREFLDLHHTLSVEMSRI